MEFNHKEVLKHTKVIDGKKDFGLYNTNIYKEPTTTIFEGESSSSDISINISVFERFERLFTTLDYLFESAAYAQEPIEVVITDNSYTENLLELIPEKLNKYKKHFTRFVYHHDPHLIQSTARNRALQSLSNKDTEFYGQLDSDIYVSKSLVCTVLNYLRSHKNLSGCSTALAGFKDSTIDSNIDKFSNLKSVQIRKELMMPGEIGEEIGYWSKDSDFLQTTMIRGVMFYRRAVCELMNNGEPWSRHLTVWQNVGFNIELNENRGQIGHIIKEGVVALHDDRYDPCSVSNLRNLPQETVKSIILICLRNRMQRFKIHDRFEKFTMGSLQYLFKCSSQESMKILNVCKLIADIISQCEDVREASIESWKIISSDELSTEIKVKMYEMIPSLFQSQVNYKSIKTFRSNNILQPIYHISNKIDY
ncbi:MAG: hypothetical protein AAGF07_02915 [Patescibacteria group bacterium]